MTALSFATINIRHALDAKVMQKTIRRLVAEGAHVIATQEMGGRRAPAQAVADELGWTLAMSDLPDVTGESATPLFLHPRFKVRWVEPLQVSNRAEVPKKAAGPTVQPPKFVTVAHAVDTVTDRLFHLASGHWFPSQHLDRMAELADLMTANVSAEIATWKNGHTILGADINNVHPFRLDAGSLRHVAGLTDAFEFSDPSTPTFKERDIDHVLWKGRWLNPTGVRVLTDFPRLDHRPLVVDFDVVPAVVEPEPPKPCPVPVILPCRFEEHHLGDHEPLLP